MRNVLVFAIGCFVTLGCERDGGAPAAQDASNPPLPMPFDVAGCAGPSLAPGDNPTFEIVHDGLARKYILYVPSGIDPKKPAPLVVNWHGRQVNASIYQQLSGNAIAEERNTIVAYPDGIGDSFNAGVCCDQSDGSPNTADDVGFGRAVVAEIATKICIDKRRVFSTGLSNGGFMSEHNACHAADLYAAVAPVSAMGILRPECPASRPISIVSFNGTEDEAVPYAVSQQNVAAWVQRNGCSGEPASKPVAAAAALLGDRWRTLE